jgi:hypothetical protein
MKASQVLDVVHRLLEHGALELDRVHVTLDAAVLVCPGHHSLYTGSQRDAGQFEHGTLDIIGLDCRDRRHVKLRPSCSRIP